MMHRKLAAILLASTLALSTTTPIIAGPNSNDWIFDSDAWMEHYSHHEEPKVTIETPKPKLQFFTSNPVTGGSTSSAYVYPIMHV